MKRIFLLLSVVCLLVYSCSKDETEGGASSVEIKVSTTALGFPDVGGTNYFNINANGDWRIEGAADWCSVNPSKGSSGVTQITVTVTSAELAEDRNIVLTVGDKTVTVTQKRTGAITLTPDKFVLDQDGGTIEVEVQHNVDFTVILSNEYSWITQVSSKADKTLLYFDIAATEEYEKREGEIIVKDNDSDAADTLKIYQAQRAHLVLSENNQTVTCDEQMYKVELMTNVEYDVQIEEGVEWIRLSETKSLRADAVNFDIDALPEGEGNREAEITFIDKNSRASDKLIICQLADGALFLMKSKFEFGASGGVVTVKLKEMDYLTEVAEGVSWLAPIPADDPALTKSLSQLRTVEISFIAYPNYGYADREGKIVVTDEETGDTDVIYVYQQARDFVTNTESTTRLLHASLVSTTEASGDIGWPQSYFRRFFDKILVNWRMLPNDTDETAFSVYRTDVTGETVKITGEQPLSLTNIIDEGASRSGEITYELYYYHSGHKPSDAQLIDTYVLSADRVVRGLPYTDIDLIPVSDPLLANVSHYDANDASVGHLLGREDYQVVIRRNARGLDEIDEEGDPDGGGAVTDESVYSPVILEAYTLDGDFMWRVICGPNLLSYNGICFAVADLDGDGFDEIVIRTSEGTVFGDGKMIGDTNGDGIIDYRPHYTSWKGNVYNMPEFVSVIDGRTGAELGRAPFIPVGTEAEWGKANDGYHRAQSVRITAAKLQDQYGLPRTCAVIARGVYGKTVMEAFEFRRVSDEPTSNMTKLWQFNTDDSRYGASWLGQGNHSLSVGDVDGDGYDEITYGAMAVDHDGTGLYTTGLGHGDALHLGDFDPKRPGLEVFDCFESGTAEAGLRSARTGRSYFTIYGLSNNDTGRAMVADIDPRSPGCEMWWAGSTNYAVYSVDGRIIDNTKPASCNFGIWFSGSANRQMFTGKTGIDSYYNPEIVEAMGEDRFLYNCRVFSVYRFGTTHINSTKENACFYGDIFGDWREEIIMTANDMQTLRIFSTWYPTEYKLPYLMSDYIYKMSAMNEHVGYNQPTHLGYYFGSDNADDFRPKVLNY
ncbi:MAG: hypothetical protein LIO79_06005 [Rikenellaceae bacterium]|nr:hypothetical protein [Rikenellaceae bacterium]